MIHTLWRRLFPPSEYVAVAREPFGCTLDIPPNPPKVERGITGDNPFIPSRSPLRTPWLGYRPEPQRKVDGSFPGPADLSPDGWCWAWNSDRHHWALVPAQYIEAATPWLPYWAIADPREP